MKHLRRSIIEGHILTDFPGFSLLNEAAIPTFWNVSMRRIPLRDFIAHQPSFYGYEISRAARIEPATPLETVYGPEPFAAALAMEAQDRFSASYVGRLELAKNCGNYPIYRVRRINDPVPMT